MIGRLFAIVASLAVGSSACARETSRLSFVVSCMLYGVGKDAVPGQVSFRLSMLVDDTQAKVGESNGVELLARRVERASDPKSLLNGEKMKYLISGQQRGQFAFYSSLPSEYPRWLLILNTEGEKGGFTFTRAALGMIPFAKANFVTGSEYSGKCAKYPKSSYDTAVRDFETESARQ